jgi:DNA-binding transcriptional LysR family regulator
MHDSEGLTAFIAIAECGSTHAAARSLNLSQAAVSRRLTRLEDSLGLSLFARDGHRLRLTPVGAKLLPVVQEHLDGLSVALAEAKSLGFNSRTTATLACLASLSLHVLPPILARLQAERPSVRLRLLDIAPIQIEESVLSGNADFALTVLGVGVPQLVHDVLREEPLVLVCPKGFAISGTISFGWKDIEHLDLIGVGPYSANQRLLDSARRSIGIHFAWKHEVQRISTALELVAAKIGFAILPLTQELAQRSDVKLVKLDQPVISRRIGILRRSGEQLSEPAAHLRRLIMLDFKQRAIPTL